MTRTLKVLLDASFSTLQHGGGIPHDTRYLFKTLATLKGVDLALLLYDTGMAGVLHSFGHARRGHPSGRLLNQSLFLESLVHQRPPWSRFTLVRAIQRFRYYRRLLLARTVQRTDLERTHLEEVVWRNFLLRGLSRADYLQLQGRHRILLSNLALPTMMRRAELGLPQPRLDTREFDLAVFQDSRPMKISANTRKIIRYHDLIPVLRADLTSREYAVWHHLFLRACLKDAVFVCNSEPTREDLLSVYPQLEKRSFTIPYALPDYWAPDSRKQLVPLILQRRASSAVGITHPVKPLNAKTPYIMMLATLEPRKNHLAVIKAMDLLHARGFRELRLLIVGELGWQYDPILEAMRAPIQRGDLVHLTGTTRDEQRVLYSNAVCSVFPSLYEGFGIPPTESLACGTPVVVSDIRPHRWVLRDAGIYCDPYSPESVADAIQSVAVAPGRQTLRARALRAWTRRTPDFTLERTAQMWLRLFESLVPRTG